MRKLIRLGRRLISTWLPDKGFRRNVIVLVGGTVLAQALSVVLSPVLTRLYTPDDLGLLASYSSIVGIALVIATLRYEMAIPLPEDDETAANLLVLTLLLIAGVSVSTGLAVWLFRDEIGLGSRGVATRVPFWSLSMGVLLAGAYKALNYWAVRQGAFLDIARSKIGQGTGRALGQVGLGLLNLGPTGLIVGQLIGWSAAIGGLVVLVFSCSGSFLRRMGYKTIRRAASRYRALASFGTLADLFNAIGLRISPLLLVALFSAEVGGLFELSQRIMGMPVLLIGQAISQVYLKSASRLARERPDGLKRLFLRTSSRLLLVGTIPIVALGVGGACFFGRVFGERWTESGVFTRMLIPLYISQIVVSPLSQTLYILEHSGMFLAWTILRLVLVVGSITGAHALRLPPRSVVAAYSVSVAVAYVALFVMSLREVSVLSSEDGGE
jgi:O-antigen/teichoic acid export membrane protein